MSSFPSSFPHANGLSALAQALAPTAVKVTYCAGNALPFRVEWKSASGPVMFFGLTPDAAATEAHNALARGSVQKAATRLPLTEPTGDSGWADAMRDLIAEIDADRVEARSRPLLRIVRGGAV